MKWPLTELRLGLAGSIASTTLFLGNGGLQLRGMNVTAGGTSSETVGPITLAGQGALKAFVAGGTVTTTLTTGNLTRQNNGVLYVQGTSAGTLGASDRILLGTAPAVTNGMVAPWMLDNTTAASTFFATYGANGFAPAVLTSADVSTSLATNIVDDADGAILAGAANAYALRLGGALTGGSLTIGSGGLIVSGAFTHATPINFNGVGVLDAITGAGAIFTGLPTASSLTKSGPGSARFNNTGQLANAGLANVVLTVHDGTLSFGDQATTNDNNGAPASATVVMTGGILNFFQNQTIAGLSGIGGTVRVGASTGGSTAKTLTLNQNVNSTYAGSLDSDDATGGDASFTKRGSGTLTLTAASRVGRIVDVNFGELLLTGAATFNGTGNAASTDRQQMAISQGGAVTLDNVGTNVAADNGTAGSNSINVATLAFAANEAIFYNASDLTVTSAMTGTGGLTKGGPGTLTLTADNQVLSGGQGVTVNGGLGEHQCRSSRVSNPEGEEMNNPTFL